jgi:hypothetical protein
MFDTFPYEEWSENISTFWTFGTGAGTYILTVLGILLMVGSLVAWVMLEESKLQNQTARLRGAGGLLMPGGVHLGPGPSQPPLAGPTTDPGT